MPISTRPIPLSSIDTTENWSLLPPTDVDSTDQLRLSIEQIGMFNPPLLHKIEGGRYRLLHGRRRVHIAEKIGLDPLVCHVLPSSIEMPLLFQTLLNQHQIESPLSPIEQAYFLRLCLRQMGEKEVITTILPMFEPRPKKNIVVKLLELLNLEQEMQSLVHQRVIGEKTAYALLRLDRDDRMLLCDLFVTLRLGHGKQQRLLILCTDISRRRDINIETLLADPSLGAILHHPEMNIPQKATRLFSVLQHLHKPGLYEAGMDFQEMVRQLNLPQNCVLEHCPFFETDQLRLQITFENEAEFEQKWKELKKLLADKPTPNR